MFCRRWSWSVRQRAKLVDQLAHPEASAVPKRDLTRLRPPRFADFFTALFQHPPTHT